MFRTGFFLAASLLAGGFSFAQKPYFQQRVDTRIEVTLDDEKHFLHGYEEFTYTNNSPDTLRQLFIHLWAAAYSHDRTAFSEQMLEDGSTDFYYSKPAQRGYIDSLRFKVDGAAATHSFHPDTPDIATLPLPAPLSPGGTAVVTTPFRVKIPKPFSRMGHTRQAYFISQWFPKPTVYDRDGWHPMPYLNFGEYYAEIGSYDVSITLPKNYVLMATGNCETAEENTWMDSLATAPRPADTLWKASWPASAIEMKTVRFTEDNIHDFAWFADKRWVVRKDTVLVPGTNNVTTAWTAFLPASGKAWDTVGTRYLKAAVRTYSRELGPYAYRTIKAVEGDQNAGGGMEYPTITLIDRGFSGSTLATVIVHEAGHNWFQGMLATNERVHPWLDEGFNTFYEHKTIAELKKDSTAAKKLGTGVSAGEQEVMYQLLATGEGQPLSGHAASFRSMNLSTDVYQKTALNMRALEGFVGEDALRAAMQDYFQNWKHRHPGPADFEAAVRRHTTKNVDWFFAEAIHATTRPDFAIRRVMPDGDSLRIRVRNRSGYTAPMEVEMVDGNSVVGRAWSDAFAGGAVMSLAAPAHWTRARVSSATADGRTGNDVWRRSGPFHRGGIGLKPFIGFNTGTRERVWVAPAIGVNTYNGFMIGALLQNAFTMPQSRSRFALAPLFGTRSGTAVGAGSAGYFIFPRQGLQEVGLQVDGKSFHYADVEQEGKRLEARYWKLAPSVTLTARERNPRSTVRRTLLAKGFFIREQGFDFTLNTSDSTFDASVEPGELNAFALLRYTHQNSQTVNPFSYSGEAQYNADFVKLSAEGKLRIDYHRKGKSLRLRGFVGKYINTSSFGPPITDRYFLNTTVSGPYDYLYEDTYVGRTEQDGIGARQVSIREGGLKLPTPFYASPLGRSDNWLASVNFSTDLPLRKLPVRAYFDAATFSDASTQNPSGARLLYSGGLQIYMPPIDAISVYIPLLNSGDYRDYLKSVHGEKAFQKSITFSVNLLGVNWLRATTAALRLVQ